MVLQLQKSAMGHSRKDPDTLVSHCALTPCCEPFTLAVTVVGHHIYVIGRRVLIQIITAR